MPKCSGPCSKQEYDVRDRSFDLDRIVPAEGNGDDCPSGEDVQRDRNLRRQLENIGRQIKTELEEEVVLTGCTEPAGQDCACSYGKAPDWGDYVEGEAEADFTVGDCDYTLFFKYEIRSRIVTGACVNVKYKSTAFGVIPDKGVVVTLAEGGFPAESLAKIEKILS